MTDEVGNDVSLDLNEQASASSEEEEGGQHSLQRDESNKEPVQNDPVSPGIPTDQESPTGPHWMVGIRDFAMPYLPPPVVRGLRALDKSQIAGDITSYAAGAEPSTILVSALLWVLLLLLPTLRFSPSSKAKKKRALAFEDDGDSAKGSAAKDPVEAVLDDLLQSDSAPGTETVVLFGASGAGKSVLFHQLCQTSSSSSSSLARPPTVVSLRANVVSASSQDGEVVRLVDFPGHAAFRSQLAQALSYAHRAVLVIDSTRPVTAAASLLQDALADSSTAWGATSCHKDARFPVLVACSKTDSHNPRSRNWRRIKLQFRTELERLRRIRQQAEGRSVERVDEAEPQRSSSSSSSASSSLVDLRHLDGRLALHFVSVPTVASSSPADAGLQHLENFVFRGVIPP